MSRKKGVLFHGIKTQIISALDDFCINEVTEEVNEIYKNADIP